MSEVEQGSVIRQFNIYDTSASPPLQRTHEIGAKAENVLIDLGEGQDPISVQDALQGSTSISEGLERIESSNLVIYSDKEHNTISADQNYNLDTLAKANSVQFTLQDYKDSSSNKPMPIGGIYVKKDPDNSANNLFYTSLKDFNCNIEVGGQTLSINKNYRTQSTNRSYSNIQITIQDTSQEPSNYCFIVNNIESSSQNIGKTNTFVGKIFDIYYKKIQTGQEIRSGKDISLIDLIYPIGSIYITTNETPPSLLFGGTWERKEGRFLLGAAATQNKDIWFNTATGGTETVALTTNQTPLTDHTHNVTEYWMNTTFNKATVNIKDSGSGTKVLKNTTSITEKSDSASRKTTGATNLSTNNTGAPHNNMPPFLAVNIWERMA